MPCDYNGLHFSPRAQMLLSIGLSIRIQRCLEVITQMFSYRPLYQARASITARGIIYGPICFNKH